MVKSVPDLEKRYLWTTGYAPSFSHHLSMLLQPVEWSKSVRAGWMVRTEQSQVSVAELLAGLMVDTG